MFARCDILLLDDTFSGLDGETEQAVFNNIFGPTGLIRRLKTTVVLVSNSCKFPCSFVNLLSYSGIAQYFQTADHIVVLGDYEILDQGNWQDIKVKAASIAKFSSSHHTQDNTILSADFDKLSAQFRAKDEAEIDLARQTGDLALYSNFFSQIHDCD